jgi:hypothetical protein
VILCKKKKTSIRCWLIVEFFITKLHDIHPDSKPCDLIKNRLQHKQKSKILAYFIKACIPARVRHVVITRPLWLMLLCSQTIFCESYLELLTILGVEYN